METKTAQLEQKIVQSQTYFFYRTTTTLRNVTEVADKEVGALLKEADRLGLEHAGPMEFVYFDCSDNPDKPFTLDIAQPVKSEVKNLPGKYRFRKTDSFKCLSKKYFGDINKIGDEYDAIFKEVFGKNMPVSNEIREVYLNYVDLSSPENITEIQIGLM